jgi:sec-independent protein translocase protein TatB
MFDSIGWGEILLLLVVALFVLGPERLPGAAAWLGRTIRQVRSMATAATSQIREELGPEFDELRKPVADLRAQTARGPRRILTDALLGDPPPSAPDRKGPSAD